MKKPLVSCVMPTYRRFTCVERSIACFLSQKTDIDTELIIMNTDIDYPLVLDETFSEFEKNKIKIFNNNTDFETNHPYNNTGSIRRDAFSYASGEYYITWDDDDLFFPWNIQQCYDGLKRTGAKAWKPYRSFVWVGGKETPSIEGNYLEATVMLYSSEVSFNLSTGPESLSWFNRLKDENQLIEDEYSIPAYCFNWNDDRTIGGHKQSGHLGHPDNFNMHKRDCIDNAKRSLTKKYLKDYKDKFKNFDFLIDQCKYLHRDLIEKYVEVNYYNE